MARFNVNDADNYGGQGGGGYFSLKNDKDKARVRFLYNSIEDVEGMSVHEVTVNGKKRYASCLKEYGQPNDVCPLCAKGEFTNVKYFVPLYDVDTGKIVVWERGKKFGSKLSSLCGRYPNLVSHIFEIERNGKMGDQGTTYEIYEIDHTPDVSLEDFDVPEILGGMVLDKSFEELRDYVTNGRFRDDGGEPAPRRRESFEDDYRPRRTPSNNGGY